MPAYFMANVKGMIIKKDEETGIPTMAVPWTPHTLIPMIDVRSDTGKFVVGAISMGEQADGKFIQGVFFVVGNGGRTGVDGFQGSGGGNQDQTGFSRGLAAGFTFTASCAKGNGREYDVD